MHRLFRWSLLGLCLTLGTARLASAQSLLALEWSEATPATVQPLLDRGAEVNARDRRGWTPLHEAALLSKTPAVVALLLDRGAEVNARTQNGQTPLHHAATSSKAVVALLLDRGAEVNARDRHGQTPLHEAAAFSKTPAVVALLLDRGADAKLRTRTGKLPVDFADQNEALTGTAVYWQLHEAKF